MNTQAQLCHIDSDRCVVLVTAWSDGNVVGSALGEAANAELAEDRALQRLMERGQGLSDSAPRVMRTEAPIRRELAPSPQVPVEKSGEASKAPVEKPVPITRKPAEASSSHQPTASDAPPTAALPTMQQEPEPSAPSEAPTDPDDWSDELAAVDLEIRRIGWDREQERSYLERAFGHSSRHKLTRYSDLVAYLKRLKALEPGTPVEAAPVPLRRSDLISQGDQMLQSLGWTSDQARNFLHQHLGSSSRQSLSDEQLLSFNMLLENELVSKAS